MDGWMDGYQQRYSVIQIVTDCTLYGAVRTKEQSNLPFVGNGIPNPNLHCNAMGR